MIARSSQPGPMESGSGKAQYTPAAASMATNAGHRGSRMTWLLMTVWRSARVEFSTVFVAPQKEGALALQWSLGLGCRAPESVPLHAKGSNANGVTLPIGRTGITGERDGNLHPVIRRHCKGACWLCSPVRNLEIKPNPRSLLIKPAR